jgi:hypothetical protein
MSAAVFAAEFIYWVLHSLLVALTFNGGGDFSFMQILGSHWQGRLIGSMVLLQLVQLPWLLVLFAYLIATTILFPRFEGVAGILVPVLLAILETIALGTHRIFSLLGSFVSIPGRQVAKLGEAFASGGTADWLAPFQNGEFATAALISLMLFVASIFWFRWREVT